MAPEPWFSDEPRLAAVARQVVSRALRRPALVFAISLVTTAAVIATRASKAPSYEATLYFHLVEGDLTDPKNAPRPLRAIREHVYKVVLSRERVERLMHKYDVSTPYLARNRVAAIDEFRDEILVDVSRNYFIFDRRQGDAPRSAQLTISLSGSTPERTRAMLHEIGDAILKEQVAQRSGHLTQARQLVDAQLTAARARMKSLQSTVDRLWLDAAKADARSAIGIRAEIAALQAGSKGAIEQVLALERRSADVAFSTAAEGQRLGLSFELFDESLATFAPRLTPFQLARLTAFVFAIALLLTVSVIGTFDDRVYTPEDMVAQGLPLFGALPRFPGDDAGAYQARMRPTVYNS